VLALYLNVFVLLCSCSGAAGADRLGTDPEGAAILVTQLLVLARYWLGWAARRGFLNSGVRYPAS